MTALRVSEWCALTLLFVMMMTLSSGQDCAPSMNTHGLIIPNTDLPTQGILELSIVCLKFQLYFQEALEPIPDYLMLRASQIEARSFNPGMSPTRLALLSEC